MRKFILYIMAVLALSVTSAYAGGNHSHGPSEPIKKEQALTYASDIVAAIAEQGEIDTSWVEVKPTEAKNKKNLFGQKWVVAFNNPKIAAQDKNTLYVFLSMDGRYLGYDLSGS